MSEPERRLGLPPINVERLPMGVSRLMLPPIPANFYPLIGAVAAFWGDFELRIDHLLASFVEADQCGDDVGWRQRNFRKRRGLLRDKANARFPGPIATEISAILDLAATYHWQRNLIVHGKFGVTNVDSLPVHAQGPLNGRTVRLIITPDLLEQLYHDLALLTARLLRSYDPDPDPHGLSWHDRSQLRAFVERHPPNLPTPETVEPPRRSSPG